MKIHTLALPFLAIFSPLISFAEGEIGFIEKFALAEDRPDAIAELIPGTGDYYFFNALLAQQEGRLADVDAFLEPWIKRHGTSQRVVEIQNRQALLRYSDDPQKTLGYLKDRLGLAFNHQQARRDAKPNFPTQLDPAKYDPGTLLREALKKKDLSGITDVGLDYIIREQANLTETQRRDLLRRVKYPDYDRLVGLIAADLRTKESQGFGEFGIHRQLTLAQLDELAALRPELVNDAKFVDTKLMKTRPGADESLARDPAAAAAHAERIWEYVSTLPETFSGLKAAILYRRLVLARASGEYPRDLFLAYIRLPRPMPYMLPDYLRNEQRKGISVDLNSDFSTSLGIPPIRNDEPLVQSYLEHYFVGDDTYARYESYIRETYLKQVFAETKLLAGVGDAERWFSMLSPVQVQSLKDRVEIEFSPVNEEHFTAADEVALTLRIKNVEELIVKVYEINALNFYLDKKQEINTDIDLDGLVANEEKTYRYEANPVLRRTEIFALDSLTNERGIFVVEFIGNGISSRALVRKGTLEYLSQTTPAGELLTLLDDELNPVGQRPVESGAAWFGGTKYEADKKGRILLPFSQSGTVPVILTDGDLASLVKVDLPTENYQFSLGVLISQETLLPGRETEIAIRPALSLHGEPVSLSKFDDVTLTVSTMDADGISSASEVEDFALYDDRESIHKLRVPTRLRKITVALSGEIRSIANPGEPIKVGGAQTFALNEIDSSEVVADAYLTRIDGSYFVEVLGKSGEPIPDAAVNFQLRHRDFTKTLDVTLKTDSSGAISIGALRGITHLSASRSGLSPRNWNIEGNRFSQPSTIHARTGDTVTIPQVAGDGNFDRSDLAIFEVRSGQLVEDVFAKAKAIDGAVALDGLAAGDYRVLLRNTGKTIDLRVTDAEKTSFGYALSAARHLELENSDPLRIASLAKRGGNVEVKVANGGELTRVHLVATRFVPEYDPFANLLRRNLSSPFQIRRGTNESRYVSGRDIGEEYRYILERRGAKKFPGNMLSRPGLLLNPWALNDTETETDEAAKGTDFERSEVMEEARRERQPAAMEPAAAAIQMAPDSPSFDFLADQALFLPNLEVDENGIVSIPIADLGDRQYLHVVAVDGTTTAYRQLSLAEPEGGVKKRDLRLRKTLDRVKDFTQRRNVTLLTSGETLVIDDLRSSELESYDTIGGIFVTLAGINPDAGLAKFRFLSGWNELDEKRKRSLYSEHASHELNFFLSRKDEDFFETVVQPYLENKKDKTFLDHYLIGNPLDRYLQPWEYGRLNIVERILLGRRIGDDERERTEKHVASLQELIPKNQEQDAFFFRQALRGRRSDAEGGFGIDLDANPGVVEFDGFINVAASSDTPINAPVQTAGSVMSRRAGRPMLVENQKVQSGGEVKFSPSLSIGLPSQMQFGEAMEKDLSELEDLALTRALYRKLETTREWAENNYYELPIEAQNADLVTVNAFWKDFAAWDGKGGFYSREFPAATGNFTEMMFALSVVDLPFSAEEHDFTVDDNELRLTAKSPVVVFHEEIQIAEKADGETPILVSQNFFRSDDRYEYEDDGETNDKFVTGEFLTGVVYGSQIVVTNPTSSNHRLDLLVQIPSGSIPVAGSDYTRSFPIGLAPFSTERQEVYFYFPKPSGDEPFAVYPVRVSKNEQVIATGGEAEFKVVDSPTNFDEKSWDHISQYGTGKEVLDYLSTANLHRIDLARIAWRTRENVDFFRSVTQLIGARHGYDSTLWSYGIYHNVTGVVREYLKHREDFLSQCGRWIDCELVSLDPVERHWYQHLEYAPLVNARTHQLGRERSILNDRFRSQYDGFLWLSAYKPELNDEDQLAVAAYLFLQDRIDEALAWLEKVDANQLTTRLQYDYLAAYAALYRGDVAEAGRISTARLEHPVDRWRERFAAVDAQVKEIRGAGDALTDEETRDGQMEKLGEKDPFLELSAIGREAKLNHRNLDAVTVNYYEMDLEFLFSSKPFVSGESGQFSFVQPNFSEKKQLPDDGADLKFIVPERFASKNVLVEVIGGGRTDSVAVYSNDLKVQLSGSYGRLEVMDETTGKPLPKTYVKVYARMDDGNVRFFKDGYTDLRGRFDYVSLNTNELDNVDELSLLVMSEEHGSLVREVDPPQR